MERNSLESGAGQSAVCGIVFCFGCNIVCYKNINQKIINNILIPIPPIEEQMRIVEKIQRLYKKL